MQASLEEIIDRSQTVGIIVKKLVEQLKELGGSDEDFLMLATPAGQQAIMQMAYCLLPPADELLQRKWRAVPIEELEIEIRAYNCLKKVGIKFVGELLTYRVSDIMDIEGFGKVSLEQVEKALQDFGLHLQSGSREGEV